MFPKVRKIFSKDELEDIGASLAVLKDELRDVLPIVERTGA
jgi:hypothetical protein